MQWKRQDRNSRAGKQVSFLLEASQDLKCLVALSSIELASNSISVSYTLQFKQAEDTVTKMELDGLVVIGGDDSNTNACLLAEYFRYIYSKE